MLKPIKTLLLAVAAAVMVQPAFAAEEKIIILNEGDWQADNGRLSYFEDGKIISNKWFRDVNGTKLGDTPNDIIQVNDNLIAIAVNWSNIVQFITPQGKAIAATESVPNNRKLATDGRYVYLTSYGHECTVNGCLVNFTKGYVAKIDINTFKVVSAVEVGYEPEGISYYKGHLFVANSGGYAFQESHDYEHTVSVIDAEAMSVTRTVDVEQINLYGTMSQSGQYLCISSPGDYYNVTAATIIFDCDAALTGKPDKDCFAKLDYASTYNTTATDGRFYAIGSRFSYMTGGYDFNYITIDPAEVIRTNGTAGVGNDLPGTLLNDLKNIDMPYSLYVNPYTGYIYATDAGDFVSGGAMLQWTPQGQFVGKYGVYINPGHILALKPDSQGAVDDITADPTHNDGTMYNLQGVRVTTPVPGQIYIQNGKKIIYR